MGGLGCGVAVVQGEFQSNLISGLLIYIFAYIPHLDVIAMSLSIRKKLVVRRVYDLCIMETGPAPQLVHVPQGAQTS